MGKLKKFILEHGKGLLFTAATSGVGAVLGQVMSRDPVSHAIGGAGFTFSQLYGNTKVQRAIGSGIAMGITTGLNYGHPMYCAVGGVLGVGASFVFEKFIEDELIAEDLGERPKEIAADENVNINVINR